ncbi:PHP domain-containing protein [Orrella daihaiensis]|uniref:PHP domain-containing protein n=1 Tax=Orrella daihaiensis TaxID=2782176 RepID=A0ABY4AG92_9BURK|nr:PHP domain-containing protein [Orrella daihaiensis]UOD49291.1 PHP domain-containing protein [Orrella daihaiensis]
MSDFCRPDLHCHSRQSDGELAPAELAMRAHAHGVDLWALTDHDDVSGVAQAREAAQSLGIGFVAGVEISVTWANRTVHVVGLGIDEQHPVLVQGLSRLRSERDARAFLIADKLAREGFADAYDGALQYVKNPTLVSRTHFARYLYASGYVSSMQIAFDRYLGEQGSAYVATQWASLQDAVSWIVAADGVAVIAHPGRYKYSELEFDSLFNEFLGYGGLGIEVCTGSHHPHENVQYAQVARDYGFLASCGSDFHGPAESRCDLGGVPALPRDLTPVWQSLSIN